MWLHDIEQGGDTPIYSVLRSLPLVKIKVKGQPPKNADGKKVKLPFGWTRVNLALYVEYGYYTS